MYRAGIFWIYFFIIMKVSYQTDEVYEPAPDHYIERLAPLAADDEYIRHIHSMINAYKMDVRDGRMVIETNALIDTKYRTWKRNADLINSLLSLPKGMNDAGR